MEGSIRGNANERSKGNFSTDFHDYTCNILIQICICVIRSVQSLEEKERKTSIKIEEKSTIVE